jgi:TonB family protein
MGTQTIQVAQLLRREPDADLFSVPEGYQMTNQPLSQQQAYAGSTGGDGLSTNGLAKAGVDGTSIPSCVYCPNPEYTDKARAAKLSGGVVLRIVVTAEGNAENITVVRNLGLGLDEKAVEAVQKWRFKPASGPDGNPVATVVPVEVTFRLL